MFIVYGVCVCVNGWIHFYHIFFFVVVEWIFGESIFKFKIIEEKKWKKIILYNGYRIHELLFLKKILVVVVIALLSLSLLIYVMKKILLLLLMIMTKNICCFDFSIEFFSPGITLCWFLVHLILFQKKNNINKRIQFTI